MAVAGIFGLGQQGSNISLQADEINQEISAKNPINREPLVTFDVSGGTLTGPVFEHLTVYDDGFASYSSLSGSKAAVVRSKMISQQEFNELEAALMSSQAMNLMDQDFTVTDVPLSTVTFFRGDTNAHSHSYSYWISSGDYSQVEEILNKFIDTQFSKTR